MTGYEKLLASGLPMSWNVMQAGLQEQLLSHEDVRVYAGDQLGRHSGDTGYLVFLLFDADPTNHAEVPGLLERLAAGERTADDRDGLALQNRAQRTWNVALLRPWVESWPRDRAEYSDYSYYYWDYDLNDSLPFPDVCDFKWPTYYPDSAEFEAVLTSLGKWLDEEEAAIRQSMGGRQGAVD